jgi:four helix bundle protein
MKKDFSFRDLEVWRLSMDLTVLAYKLTDSFPEAERFGITSQIRRASSSIPANISEGWARGTQGNLANSLRIARGSLGELETFLELARRLGFTSAEQLSSLQPPLAELAPKLYRFLRKVETSYVREEDPIDYSATD